MSREKQHELNRSFLFLDLQNRAGIDSAQGAGIEPASRQARPDARH